MQRNAIFYFLGLLALAAAGFWPTYLAPPRIEGDWHVHLHGLAMFAWMGLLISQAWFVRSRRLALHRAVGRVSYGLVPVIVASTLLLAHYRMRQGLGIELLYFFYVQLSLLAVFVASYALAIANRRRPAVHARYMACVALTLVDPIVARILAFTFGTGFPVMQAATYGAVDAILLALIASDARAGLKPRVYPAMLAVFVATQLPTFFLYRTAAWRTFTESFAALPLP